MRELSVRNRRTSLDYTGYVRRVNLAASGRGRLHHRQRRLRRKGGRGEDKTLKCHRAGLS